MSFVNSSIPIKYTFSGHDSFQCRFFWLKKGYDFVNNNKSFSDEDAVVQLGVGRNMVNAIRFWLKAFNITDVNDNLTEFGNRLFNDDGWDPFLEDEASLWLLHFQLVKNNLASIYSIIFNDFRKEKVLFTKESFVNYMKRRRENEGSFYLNESTIANDYDVFVKTYKSADDDSKDIEDSFSGILSELNLLEKVVIEHDDRKKEVFLQIPYNEKDEIPKEVLLYSILDNSEYGMAISLNSLAYDFNSPGSIFSITQSGLVNKINEIVADSDLLIYNDHAGIKELQFKSKPSANSVMDRYYGK